MVPLAQTEGSANPTISLPRVLIADDHEIVRQGVRHIVTRDLGWTVCGEANDGKEAVSLAEELAPDIAVLDLSMPHLSGLEATRQLRKRVPALEIVVFSGIETREIIHEIFEAGARSFIPKTEMSEHLALALRSAVLHKPYFPSKVAEVVFERYLTKVGQPVTPTPEGGLALTPREREIVQLLAEGKSNKEIGAALSVAVKTVETHRASVMRKLRVGSFAELVRYAVRNHLVQP